MKVLYLSDATLENVVGGDQSYGLPFGLVASGKTLGDIINPYNNAGDQVGNGVDIFVTAGMITATHNIPS